MKACRLCGAAIEPFIALGPMPAANGFLREEDYPDEYFFELSAAFCDRCAMPQLVEGIAPEMMFHDRYPFFTSSSAWMTGHFRDLATQVMREHLKGPDSFVVEIGSNDGTLLENFVAAGVRHLGVEPSGNVAAAAEEKGVRTLRRFFDEALAREIVRDHGHADVILAANCLCHVPELRALAAGLERLLKPRGLLIFEDPYLGDIVGKTAYDQIYDEHVFYFSVAGVERWLEPHRLVIVDVEPLAAHGGSMRYTVGRRGAWPVGPRVEAQRRAETRMGLHRPRTYAQFRLRVERSRDDLVALLRRLKQLGKRVVGYGATSKSTTVMNYCGITPDLIEFISDTTPLKQGKFSPGMHIPVRPHSEFVSRYPDHAVLFAWNHAAEIMQKESGYRSAGGKWIAYVPEVKVLD